MTSPLEGIEDRYRRVYSQLSALIDYSRRLIEAQTSHACVNIQQSYAEKIFVKLLCHALTLRNLSPTPGASNELWDLSSQYAIARTLIETYEALAYIGTDTVSDPERQFRMLLWKLHSAERRSQMLELIGSRDPECQRVLASYNTLKDETLAHPFLATVSNGLKAKIERGDTPPYHLSRKERDKQCGIDPDYHTVVIMHLSQHVHTLPFSVDQLLQFQTGDPECLRLMSVAVEYATGFLAKSLIGIIGLFAPRVPAISEDVKRALDMWEQVLMNGVKNTP